MLAGWLVIAALLVGRFDWSRVGRGRTQVSESARVGLAVECISDVRRIRGVELPTLPLNNISPNQPVVSFHIGASFL